MSPGVAFAVAIFSGMDAVVGPRKFVAVAFAFPVSNQFELLSTQVGVPPTSDSTWPFVPGTSHDCVFTDPETVLTNNDPVVPTVEGHTKVHPDDRPDGALWMM